MPILAEIEGTLSVTADPFPSLAGTVFVTDDDPFRINLSVTEFAAVAFAERHQRLGYSVQLGRLDGTMVTLEGGPYGELAAGLTINEDADRLGDMLKFSAVGPHFSPMTRKLLLARVPVTVDIVTGSPQHQHRERVFEGVVIEAPYSGFPPTAAVTCGDADALYAERRAPDWILAENSNRTRLDITLELLGIGGIPAGELNTPPDGGGRINKSYAIGDTPIVTWLRGLWRVVGCEVFFAFWKFVITRYEPDAVPVAELNGSNTMDWNLDPPTTLDPNVSTVVAVAVSRTDTLAEGAPVETLAQTLTNYQPVAAVQVQDAGVVTANDVPTFAQMQVIAELRTRTTKRGTVDVRYEEEVKGMLAKRAARVKLRDTRSLVEPDEPPYYDFVPVADRVYIFPDASTREDREESLQTTRKLLRLKVPNADNVITHIREERRELRSFRRALFEVGTGVDGESADMPIQFETPLADDGQGVYVDGFGRMEFLEIPLTSNSPTTLVLTDITLNEDGTTAEELVREYSAGPGAKIRRAEDIAFGYGQDNREWYPRESELNAGFLGDRYGNLTITRRQYRSLSGGEAYETIETTTENGGQPVIKRTEQTGSLPRPEKIEAVIASQEIRSTTKDAVRITLAGEEIEAVEHNEFLQSQAEADFYCRFLAREKGAQRLTCGMPFEGQLHKHKPVTSILPGAEGKFYIRQVDRDTGQFSQRVTALSYDPLLS